MPYTTNYTIFVANISRFMKLNMKIFDISSPKGDIKRFSS